MKNVGATKPSKEGMGVGQSWGRIHPGLSVKGRSRLNIMYYTLKKYNIHVE